MLSSRTFLLFSLSVIAVTAVLYYLVAPDVPQPLHWKWPIGLGQADKKGTMSNVDKPTSEKFSKVEKFTPEVLLSAPRRSEARPNPSGELLVYTSKIYSFALHSKATELRVLNVNDGRSRLISSKDGISSPQWLSDKELIWLESDENKTDIVVGLANESVNSYIAGSVAAPASDLKLKRVEADRVHIAFVAQANPDGTLYSPAEKHKSRSSGMLYASTMVRHWDKYVTNQRNALWHAVLSFDGKHKLGSITNILKGSRLESPIPPFGGQDHFDVGTKGVVFVARDPDMNAAFTTKSDLYHVAISGGRTSISYSAPQIARVNQTEGTGWLDGASSSPTFSPDGESVVWLQMKKNGYEADKNHLVLVDLDNLNDTIELMQDYMGQGLWDRSPKSVSWTADGHSLLLIAEDEGRTKLFKVDVPESPRAMTNLPEALTTSGSISDVQLLGESPGRLLVSGSSLIENSFYSTLDMAIELEHGATPELRTISANADNGTLFSLSDKQVSEIWFTGAGDYKVHAWVIKPSTFREDRKYPLALLVHGGPQGSWSDSWSTRWNPAIFAEQGYIVVAPDPTGSTGYGQKFTDGIKGEWGGRPYKDLVKCFEYIEKEVASVDTSKAVALGASYGGFMMAWMQGQPLGKKFKALVCHDGSFNLPAQLASDEQYFPNHDLGGPPTVDPHAWEKWTPSAHVANWTTPMLIIHNELDYRLPISEGLAMFNVLQERSIESKFLTFPDENHWVLKEENSLVWHTVVLNWINSHVGLPPYKNETDLDFTINTPA